MINSCKNELRICALVDYPLKFYDFPAKLRTVKPRFCQGPSVNIKFRAPNKLIFRLLKPGDGRNILLK